MSYTKGQVSNFLDDKILFRFGISSDYIIKFDANEELFTFNELEKIIASNFGYWNSIYDDAQNDFKSEWEKLKDRYNTIKNNILFGNPNASDNEVINAAIKAHCHEFISKLPNGYDTIIGDGGATLSGGEKQRISIARAILKDSPIIILDEATASVDPENEHLIQNAISSLTKGKTVIVIDNRLATIQDADQILVIDNGDVVQKGNHLELINQDGIYKNFINIKESAEGWCIS